MVADHPGAVLYSEGTAKQKRRRSATERRVGRWYVRYDCSAALLRLNGKARELES